MNDTIRIRFSCGLLIVAVIHAIALACVFVGMQDLRTVRTTEPVWRVPSASDDTSCYGPSNYAAEQLQQPASVNLRAQGEVKQQGCVPCQQQQSDWTYIQQPTLIRPQAAVPATVPRKPYQISLFVTGDERSNVLLQWFQRDPSMLKLREKAEFQIYTSDSPVYRARFATAVPVDQFPVVLLTDATGGHIHAAAKSMLPRTCAELFDDMKTGFANYTQSKKTGAMTGAMKTTGYSWDDAIKPTMRLSTDECPDGNCPAVEPPSWKPGDRVRDVLFNDGPSFARDALVWANMYEIATVGIIFILGCSIAFVLVRRAG